MMTMTTSYIDLLQCEVNKAYDQGKVYTVERYNLITKKTEDNLVLFSTGQTKHSSIQAFVSQYITEDQARTLFYKYAQPGLNNNGKTVLRLVKLAKMLVDSRNSLPDYVPTQVVKIYT